MIWNQLKNCKLGESFAVVSGPRTGELLILLEIGTRSFGFLSYPLNVNREYDTGEFEFDRKQDKIKFIERIPKSVVKELSLVYNNNKKRKDVGKWDKITLKSMIRKNNENTNHRRK